MSESKPKLTRIERDLIEIASEWFWEMGPDLRFTFFSDNVERLIGVPAAFHIGKTRQELAGSDSLSDTWQQHFQDLRDHKPFKDFRYNRLGHDGHIQYLSISGKPIFDENKCFQGYIGAGSDLTIQIEAEERAKLAEAKLIESSDRIKDFSEIASDWIWEMDENLRFSYFSDQFTQVTGVRQNELLGLTREENGNPGASDEDWEKQLSDLRERKSFKGFIHSRPKLDGSQVWLSISGAPIYREGAFKGFRGVGSDITERIDFEKTINRLLHAIQHVPVGIALFDEKDRLIFFNSQYKSIMGTMGDILKVGETFENMLLTMVKRQPVKDAVGREKEYMKERLAKRRAPGPPVEIHRTDRELLALESRAPDGYTFNIITDITEQKRTEKDLIGAKNDAEIANKAKSVFLASMSHELRTPLNAILGFSEILRDQHFGPPGAGKYKEYAGDIHHSGAHLLELVNDLLDISSIEAGKTLLDIEIVSIQEIIEDCTRTVKEKAIAKDIQITMEVSKDLIPIYLDKRAVKQILLNLLSNAVKFTPKGGKIAVYSNSKNGKTQIIVKDNGQGIPPEDLPNIANPFTRSVNDPHIAEQGWGLGLAISKSLVELHNGKMLIESEVGKGTSVIITFPPSPSGVS